MKSQTLRFFIREAIREKDYHDFTEGRDLGAEREIQDYKKEKAAGQIPLSARDMPTAAQKMDLRIGEMGALYKEDGDPDFVVIAQNIGAGKLIVKKHTLAQDDQLSNVDFENKIDATTILPNSPVLSAALSGISPSEAVTGFSGDVGSNVWYILDRDKEELRNQVKSTNKNDPNIGIGYYLVSQNQIFKTPRAVYTPKFRSSVENFGCELTFQKSCEIIARYDVHSQEWALAAACFYEHAGSLKSTFLSVLVGGALGAAIGAIAGAVTASPTGPGALAAATAGAKLGFVKGASWAPLAGDLLLRLPVLWWSWHNNKRSFFWANIVYMVIVAAFNITVDFGGVLAKMAPARALKFIVDGIEGVAQFARIPAIRQLLSRAGTDTAKFSWKSLFAEIVMSLASLTFGGVMMEEDKQKIIAFLDNQSLFEGDLEESRTALLNDLRTRFPDR